MYEQNNYSQPPQYNGGGVTLTQQVSAVMRKVYVRMLVGLLITAFVALGVASSPAAITFIFTNKIVFWGMWIAMLAMAFIIPARLTKMSSATVLALFCVFAALMGASLSSIFYVYELGTITYTFFITAGTFGAMSIYGYVTKADLSKFGTYLIMGVFGLIIASIVNIFLHSTQLEWIISIAGVLIFTGLTAWDTQAVKRMAQANLEPEMTDKLATMGALNLYLDFINLFLYLLRIFGNRN